MLAEIDERPNLQALPDDDYLALLADLLGNLGLETTEPVHTDSGARWVATDPRPVFGGTGGFVSGEASTTGAAGATQREPTQIVAPKAPPRAVQSAFVAHC